ncbi:hypothetical protein [Tunicatimonas pelagia]|uniref:hypothetical protein n=1 Tax=Tunicatimonas pelagia TaxID=931531 RepID=UPI0026655C56|nr:hypothetical protein [Tunicatimonas pelagia]WKN46536.1 hypothetical protein P0M28_30980 [Tunicatimonas pelagia]
MAVNIPKKGKSKLGEAPSVEDKSNNNLETPSPSKMVNMVFTVPFEFRQEYKMFAVSKGISMLDVLKKSFEEYKHR